ncbi:hypothetical protein PG985_001703 [Apiospora marii]|uniref:CCHC-type domain-containing protein n=1 Tax=Apiospora marii TaxID=335849 RepID=A0ABR1T0Z9_9PEZI
MADKKPVNKGPPGVFGALLARARDAEQKRKRQDGEDGADDDDAEEMSLAPPAPMLQMLSPRDVEARFTRGGALAGLPSLRNPEDRNFAFGGSNNTFTCDDPDTASKLPYQFADLQPDGQFPDSTVHYRRNNQFANLLAERGLNRMRALGPNDSRAPSRAPSSRAPLRAPSLAAAQAPSLATTAKSSAPQQTMGPPKKKAKRGGNRCGNCGKHGHKVKDCAGPPAEDGFIHACPVHNSGAHTLDECREAQNMTLEVKYTSLVSTRHNLCPLYFNEAWEDTAWTVINSVGDANVKDALPFSSDFSKTIPLEKFDAYDYDAPDPACLGHEPETATIAAFKAWYRMAILGENTQSEHPEPNDQDTLEYSRHALDPNVDATIL